jgi:hypothetical protein
MTRRALLTVALVVAALVPASAHVTRIEIVSRHDVAAGAAFGSAGAYEEIDARAYFADDPALPANAAVVDLGLAPRNAGGLVESSADLEIIRPKNAARANGTLLVEIPNRGERAMPSYLMHATAANPQGDGFLLTHGYTLAWIGWEWDIPADPKRLRLAAPIATQNGLPMTGLVRSDFVPDRPVSEFPIGHRGMTPYPIANENDPRTALTVRDSITGPRRTLPRKAWRFARWIDGNYVPDSGYVAARAGFSPGHIYELVYVAKDPIVTGLGFTAVRDVVSYLKHDPRTLAPVKCAIGFGVSQSGRFLRHALYQGFNADENGARVFDGIFADVAGAGRGSFNHRFAQPSRDGPSFSSFFYPTDLFPFTDASESDPFGGPDDGLLTHAGALGSGVKIVYSFGSYEYWSRGASLTQTTADGSQDVALPPNVRLYAIAGTQHVPGLPSRHADDAVNPTNPNDFTWALRAQLVALDRWITSGAEPPPSRYPTIKDATLVKLGDIRFPEIPGVTLPGTFHHEYALDFGPDFAAHGIASLEPPNVGDEYGVRLPQVDLDGNEEAGIVLPEVAVPLGTYTGWNPRAPEDGFPRELVDFTGSFIAFRVPVTTGPVDDPRPSILDRYTDRAGYLAKYAAAAQRLAAAGYLLPEDVPALQARAEALWHAIVEAP